MAAALGAGAGGLVWLFLKLMEAGMLFFWGFLPGIFAYPFYPVAVCALGGVAVGICQKKYGAYPEVLETVIEKFKTGGYAYDKLHGIFLCALVPLIFGGCIGPEAGLSGVIFGFCTWIGDKLKDDVKDRNKKNDLYIVAAIVGVAVFYLLVTLFGGGMELHRFGAASFGTGELLWFIPLIALGALAGLFYALTGRLMDLALRPAARFPVPKAVAGGLALGISGVLLPFTMFSGETQMGVIMGTWESVPVSGLLLLGFLKLVIVNVCIKSGWRGGHIFPLIFSGICIGYAMAAYTGIDGVFATAVITAALCGTVMKQPLIVAAVLLLFYPLTFTSIAYICIAAFLGSRTGIRIIRISGLNNDTGGEING